MEMEIETPKMINVIFSDGKEKSYPIEILEKCQTIKEMMADVVCTEDIPMPNCSFEIFELVAEWCANNKNPRTESEETNDKKQITLEDFSEWERNFIKGERFTRDVLFELSLAANYLNVRPLLNLVCVAIAGLLKGKTTEEMREILGVENDFTPEEEEQIRKENEWCEEK